MEISTTFLPLFFLPLEAGVATLAFAVTTILGVESLVQGFNAGAVVKKEDIRGGHHLVTVPGAVFWPCLKHLQVRVAFMPIVCSNLLWDRIVATHILTILSHHQPAALLECKLVCSEPTAPATDGGMQ
jgi:hypothetical protein